MRVKAARRQRGNAVIHWNESVEAAPRLGSTARVRDVLAFVRWLFALKAKAGARAERRR